MLVLLGLLLVMLVVVAGATTNSTHFEQVYAWLLLASAVGLAVLAALILYNLISLFGLYRRQVPGARLILRLVGIFAVLAITPVALVYGFSLNFLQRGIDSWFNVQVDRGLEDALELSRTALDLRMRDVLKADHADCRQRRRQRRRTGGPASGRPARFRRGVRADSIRARWPDHRHRHSLSIVGVAGTAAGCGGAAGAAGSRLRRPGADPRHGFHIRVVVRVTSFGNEDRLLQALFPVTDRLSLLADAVQAAFDSYKN